MRTQVSLCMQNGEVEVQRYVPFTLVLPVSFGNGWDLSPCAPKNQVRFLQASLSVLFAPLKVAVSMEPTQGIR